MEYKPKKTVAVKVPEKYMSRWQRITEILAKFMAVSDVFITQYGLAAEQSIICNNDLISASHPSQEKINKNSHNELIKICVPFILSEAMNTNDWQKSVDLPNKSLQIFGTTLLWPDEKPFGSISIIDEHFDSKGFENKDLLMFFKELIEDDLQNIRETISSDPEMDQQKPENFKLINEETVSHIINKNREISPEETQLLTQKLNEFKEKFLQNLFASYHERILLVDRNGIILDANDAAIHFFDLQSTRLGHEKYIPADDVLIQSDEHRFKVTEYLETATLTTESHQDEKVAIIRKGQNNVWLKVKKIQVDIEIHGYNGVLFTFYEADSQSKAIEELKWLENKNKLTQVTQNTGTWEIEIATKSMSWSDGLYWICGFEPGEVTPSLEQFISIIDENDRSGFEATINKAIEKGEYFSFETQIITHTGETKSLFLEGGPDKLRNGHAGKLFGSIQDISLSKDDYPVIQITDEELKLKRNSLTSTEEEIHEYELSDMIDIPAVQSLLEDFTSLTGYTTAVLDIYGKIVVATGWQDICTCFHRIHPESAKNCLESDLYLAKNTRAGEYVAYKCKNNLWDMVTPLYIAGKHVGNIYTGQFFYDEEDINKEIFENQAQRYGYNKEAYLDALKKVPHISRKDARILMDFLTKFSALVSRLGYINLELEKAISQQKRIEAALRESESHFRMLINKAPTPIAMFEQDGKIEYINETFKNIYGYTLEDIPDLEAWWEKAYPDNTQKRDAMSFWQQANLPSNNGANDLYPNEQRIIGKDGTPFIVEIAGTQIGSKTLVLLNDITDRKHLEESMMQREKLASIGTLAAGITHEMNSPLQVITGIAEGGKKLLDMETPDREDLITRFNLISKNAWRLARIVRSLLDYAHYAPGDSAVYCSLNNLVEKTLTLTEHQFKSWSNIYIKSRLADDLPLTVLDGNQITQVIINLLTNARDAMPDGGEIFIETSYDEKNNVITLRISDTGHGIPAEIQNKIFDPFFTTKPIGEGTGLGLSIIAGIIRGHRGKIELEKSSKHGTTFKITLPIVTSIPLEDTKQHQGRY